MESWHFRAKPPFSCGKRLYIEEGTHVEILNLIFLSRQMAHSAAVVAPLDFADIGLQRISSSLQGLCRNSQSHLLVPKKIESLASSRLPLFCGIRFSESTARNPTRYVSSLTGPPISPRLPRKTRMNFGTVIWQCWAEYPSPSLQVYASGQPLRV